MGEIVTRRTGQSIHLQRFSALGREGNPHAIEVKHSHQRVGQALGYAFLVGIDPHGRQRG